MYINKSKLAHFLASLELKHGLILNNITYEKICKEVELQVTDELKPVKKKWGELLENFTEDNKKETLY